MQTQTTYLLSRLRLPRIGSVVLPDADKCAFVEIADCKAPLATRVELLLLYQPIPVLAVYPAIIWATYADIDVSVIVCLQFGHHRGRIFILIALCFLARARRAVILVWRGAFLHEAFFKATATGTATFEACHYQEDCLKGSDGCRYWFNCSDDAGQLDHARETR